MLELSSAILLIIAAFGTSIISATVGMAGGTVLLSVMLLFLTPQFALPIHAANQLISNFRRCWLLRTNIHWQFFYRFCFGAIIGNIASTWLLQTALDLKHGTIFIAAIILYSVFKPKKLPSFVPKENGFMLVGLLIGFAGMFIGATGLILGTCFIRDDMDKEHILATQGAMQTFNHLGKILGFLWLGFNYIPWILPLGAMMLASFFGTTYGVSLVRKIPDHIFRICFRGILVLSALSIIYKWIKDIAY
tara:strand:- start:581 stop:1324 length:744 start_codon:yes stop_codon:yes gene_type:complete